MAAPIALFVYKRPDHTHLVVESLVKNPLAGESDLFIFADGARNEQEQESVLQVRSYLQIIQGFRSVHIQEQKQNLGLAGSIIAGVSWIMERYEQIIVLEDDTVPSPYFLQYMNDALTKYRDETQVHCIHAYVFPVKEPLPDTFFLRGAECWGWATWRRGWQHFEPDGEKLLRRIKEQGVARQFDLMGTYPYTQMLQDQSRKLNDSWAIRWRASTFLQWGLTLWPGHSLVKNIGHDGSGTNCSGNQLFDVTFPTQPLSVTHIPIEENAAARKIFAQFFKSIQVPFYRRQIRKLHALIRKVWSITIKKTQ